MKRTIFLLLISFLLFGCQKPLKDNHIDNFIKKMQKSKSYHLKGTMEVNNDEESFSYDLDVKYLKKDKYIIDLKNQVNNQRQIILKNKEGLYVVTPSLNKSFKFESKWPNNSSQGYILSSLVRDIKNDDKASFKQTNNNIVIKTSVDYPNNADLIYQKIYLDKDYNIKHVDVYSDADIIKIKIIFNSFDLKANIDADEFNLDNFIENCDEQNCKTERTIGKISEAIYPLYIPANTKLTSSEIIGDELDARAILTFSGDKNFTLVEESSVIRKEHEVIPVYGEPVLLNDSIGALANNSVYWTSGDIDYYLVSNDLTVAEMVFVATSLNNSRQTMVEK